jgi:hypothetical protein
MIAQSGSRKLARPLAPLLDDVTYVEEEDLWRVCDEAARTIATLLHWEESIDPNSDLPARDALIRKIRKWAETAE